MSLSVQRSWLFVPGHRQRMVEKALGLTADVVIFDLEDGVPREEKEVARKIIAATLERGGQGPLRYVRTRQVGHSELDGDLDVAVRPGVDGLVLPKVERSEDLIQLDARLTEREIVVGLSPGSIRLLVMIESAQGLMQAAQIAGCSSRVVGLMFGAEDFALDLGLFGSGSTSSATLLYARSALVVAAASAGVQAVDRVFTDIQDLERLVRETCEARALGFSGKSLIHPGQIEGVHRGFRPEEEELVLARRIVEAFEAAGGGGAIAVDGRMVDLPVVERARRLLETKVDGN